MSGSSNINYLVAFTGGLLTFLSPCIFPLIPSFIAYIAGVSFDDLKDSSKKAGVFKKTVIHSLLFVLGFSFVFVALGLTATALGKVLFQYQNIIRIAGGALIIIFGLHLTGLLKLEFLNRERHIKSSVKRTTYLGSFLVGVTFAAAWTPCAGAILGSILVLAGTTANLAEGAKLLTVYSLGIATPFLLTAIAVNSFLKFFEHFKNIIGKINIIAGVLLIIVGVLLMTGYLSVISQKLLVVFGG